MAMPPLAWEYVVGLLVINIIINVMQFTVYLKAERTGYFYSVLSGICNNLCPATCKKSNNSTSCEVGKYNSIDFFVTICLWISWR